jgi:hypothetical protein
MADNNNDARKSVQGGGGGSTNRLFLIFSVLSFVVAMINIRFHHLFHDEHVHDRSLRQFQERFSTSRREGGGGRRGDDDGRRRRRRRGGTAARRGGEGRVTNWRDCGARRSTAGPTTRTPRPRWPSGRTFPPTQVTRARSWTTTGRGTWRSSRITGGRF